MSNTPHVTRRRTYRQTADDEYGLLMCASHDGCSKKWTQYVHARGRVDGAGVIHFAGADRIPRRPGMRRFLILVGWSLNDTKWERLPYWQRLYTQNVWASKEARGRFHMVIPANDSIDDRNKSRSAAKRKGVKLRTVHFMAYQWSRAPLLYTGTST